MANDLALTDNKRAWPHFGSRLKPTAATLLDEPDLAPHTIAQHYGVPTRLLDWTRDPLTALAFALEGAENSSELTIWAFDHKDYLAQAQNWLQPGEHSLHIYEGSGRENSYLHAQRGAFTYIHRGEVTYLRTGTYPTVDQIVPDFMFKRFSIPVTPEAKVHLAVGLIRERRTRAHLMPNLSSCAEVAVSTFRLGLNF